MLENITTGKLAEEFNLEVSGDQDLRINGIASLFDAEEGTLSFIRNTKYLKNLETTKAAAIIVPEDADLPQNGKTYLKSKSPYISFAEILKKYYEEPINYSGISDKAHIDQRSSIAEPCKVEPFVFVDSNSKIGQGCSIASGTRIGKNVSIGENVVICANVSIEANTVIGNNCIINAGVVIGSDGFGFDQTENGNFKFPQIGNVIIEDDVEVGANTTIDRGSLGSTVIGQGTKIDNQAQIGHGAILGKHNVICSQVAIAGSVIIEDNVIFAAKSGIGDHLRVGQKSIVGPMAGVTKDLPENGLFSGFPAMPHQEWLKVVGIIAQLPQLREQLKFLKNFSK
jgi:UDP-3-O-[3-hydroxymyristoyl] glucosamine N-acyltransferase